MNSKDKTNETIIDKIGLLDELKDKLSNKITLFFTKVYLELSRQCNARCKFCRNSSFEQTKYDLNQIIETLNSVKKYVNAVVIGGGEPTLKIQDVMRLKECCDAKNFDWHLFTNGSNLSLINRCITDNFKLNLSRHAVDDVENARVFGLNPSKTMTYKDIEELNRNGAEITLNATCFNGALDSVSKIIDYIEFAKAIGCKKVLIQDLQQDSSLGIKDKKYNDLLINPKVFELVMEYLKAKGFRQKKYQLVGTGGYVSSMFKDNDHFLVTIQKYVTKKELNELWPTTIKRIFDLSIDPSGKLFENWNQIDNECQECSFTE